MKGIKKIKNESLNIILNYLLIENYDLRVIGEIYLPIELQLLGKTDRQLADIKEIISHPMALGQSQLFLAEHDNVLVTEYKDTSSCAKMVAEDSSGKLAVIGGPVLAKAYNLQVLVDNVCDVKQNFTRFYILSKGSDYVSNILVCPSGKVIIKGTAGVGGFNKTTSTAEGPFLASFSQPALATSQFDLDKNISVYPNPTTNEFNIKISENLMGAKATIYNILGQKVKDFTLNSLTTNQNLDKGMYLIAIEKGGNKTTRKLIIQ